MSYTPRTDAKLAELKITEQSRHGYKLDKLAAYCRELERELAESNALLLQARTMLDDAAHGRIELSPSDSSNISGQPRLADTTKKEQP